MRWGECIIVFTVFTEALKNRWTQDRCYSAPKNRAASRCNRVKRLFELRVRFSVFSLKLADIFQIGLFAATFQTGMLMRARARARQAGVSVSFSEGNILISANNLNRMIMFWSRLRCTCFHRKPKKKFSSELSSVARKAVVIIRSWPKWKWARLLWMVEGEYYDQDYQTNFEPIARKLGRRSFQEDQIEDCTVYFLSIRRR